MHLRVDPCTQELELSALRPNGVVELIDFLFASCKHLVHLRRERGNSTAGGWGRVLESEVCSRQLPLAPAVLDACT